MKKLLGILVLGLNTICCI